jgi:hypothetical protein
MLHLVALTQISTCYSSRGFIAWPFSSHPGTIRFLKDRFLLARERFTVRHMYDGEFLARHVASKRAALHPRPPSIPAIRFFRKPPAGPNLALPHLPPSLSPLPFPLLAAVALSPLPSSIEQLQHRLPLLSRALGSIKEGGGGMAAPLDLP